MRNENLFYLIVVLAVIAMRLGVYIVPEVDVMFMGIVLHHYVFGLIMMAGAFLFEKHSNLRLWIFAIGLGLVLDEIMFLALGSGKDAQYWAPMSSYGTVLLLFAVFPLREKLLNYVYVLDR